jgi:hypothetical protein
MTALLQLQKLHTITCDWNVTTNGRKVGIFSPWWGETESLGTAATTGLLYQPRMIGDGDCGEIGGMKIGRANRSTRKNPAPAPLCPPQIPGLNPGRSGGKPATNHLSYGAAKRWDFERDDHGVFGRTVTFV